jgi:glycerol uptake facilitator-like aquaporin
MKREMAAEAFGTFWLVLGGCGSAGLGAIIWNMVLAGTARQ